VTVARARGEGLPYIVLREILPNLLGPLAADFGIRFVLSPCCSAA
jgi:peptide/nickel transport system permease protein